MARSSVLIQIVAVLGLQAVLFVVLWNLSVPRWVVWASGGMMAATLPLLVLAAVVAPRVQSSPRVLAMRERPRAGALFMVGLALCMWLGTAAMLAQTGGSFLVKLIGSSQHMAFFLGFALIGYGCRRVGGERFCRKCEYEMSPEIEAEPGLDRCPECGSMWKAMFGTVRGKRVIRKGWIAAGVCIPLLLMAWPLISISRPGLRRAPLWVMPMSSLMAETTSRNSITAEDAVTVLQARGLTPAQEVRLATMLLDKQKSKGHISAGPRDWLTTMQSSGKLSPELSRRFLEEHPYPALIRGDRTRLGLPAGPTSVGP